jgi:hypothetical protein
VINAEEYISRKSTLIELSQIDADWKGRGNGIMISGEKAPTSQRVFVAVFAALRVIIFIILPSAVSSRQR